MCPLFLLHNFQMRDRHFLWYQSLHLFLHLRYLNCGVPGSSIVKSIVNQPLASYSIRTFCRDLCIKYIGYSTDVSETTACPFLNQHWLQFSSTIVFDCGFATSLQRITATITCCNTICSIFALIHETITAGGFPGYHR